MIPDFLQILRVSAIFVLGCWWIALTACIIAQALDPVGWARAQAESDRILGRTRK